MSTAEERQAWRELAAAATPGEWFYRSQCIYGGIVLACVIPIRDNADADAAFIAAARTAVPALLADVERLEQLWRGASKDVQYLQHDGATWKHLFEDMQQKCDKARAERDALAAELATVRAQLYAVPVEAIKRVRNAAEMDGYTNGDVNEWLYELEPQA